MSQQPLYLDTAQPREARVKDLIAQLTLAEKVGLMSHPAKGVARDRRAMAARAA